MFRVKYCIFCGRAFNGLAGVRGHSSHCEKRLEYIENNIIKFRHRKSDHAVFFDVERYIKEICVNCHHFKEKNVKCGFKIKPGSTNSQSWVRGITRCYYSVRYLPRDHISAMRRGKEILDVLTPCMLKGTEVKFSQEPIFLETPWRYCFLVGCGIKNKRWCKLYRATRARAREELGRLIDERCGQGFVKKIPLETRARREGWAVVNFMNMVQEAMKEGSGSWIAHRQAFRCRRHPQAGVR